jgi:hypothetical protein
MKKIKIINHACYIANEKGKDMAALSYLQGCQEALDTSMIPPMVRRRCSPSSKIALSLASKVLTENEVDYLIFCSQHGEITNTLKLLQELYNEEAVSPLGFSQSVHNTASGIFNIINKLTKPSTSIAAGKHTFVMGMVEAITWLALNPGKKVLLVVFDVTLPEPYDQLNLLYDSEYGAAFLLANCEEKNNSTVALKIDENEIATPSSIPPALVFLNWFLSKSEMVLKQNMGVRHLQWGRDEY